MFLVPYHQELLDSPADIFLLSYKPFSAHQPEALEKEAFYAAVQKIKDKGKKAFLWVSRFIFEPELEECLNFLRECTSLVDGFLINDFGLMYALRQEAYQGEIYLHTDTTITSSEDVKVFLEHGFDKVVLARELTLEEYTLISRKLPGKIIASIFGHQIISSSRRLLLSAYLEELQLELDTHKIYKMQEEKRNDFFYVMEDESGFHVYDGRYLNALAEIPTLLASSCEHFIFESFALPLNHLNTALNLAKTIEAKTKLNQNAEHIYAEAKSELLEKDSTCESILEEFENEAFVTKALWYTKTIEVKEALQEDRLAGFFEETEREDLELEEETLSQVPALPEELEQVLKLLPPRLAKPEVAEHILKKYSNYNVALGSLAHGEIGERIELLAPAGDLLRLKTAVLYGADAVFIGGKKFSLRSRASNLTLEDIREGVAFAHQRGCRIHVTVNLIPHEEDFDGFEAYVLSLEKAGVDAAIMASPAFMKLTSKVAPNIEIHVSTQTSITNSKTIEFYKVLGADRVVVARELTLEELKAVRKKSVLPIETFAHGGMCVNYSGRCTLSNYMTLRDANRGGCAQSCRWRYKLFAVDVEQRRTSEIELNDSKILFSMGSKDLNAMKVLPALIENGMASLKIEGRMKTVYYIATVVSTYRQAIDALYNLQSEVPEQKLSLAERASLLAILEEGARNLRYAENRKTSTGFYFQIPRSEGQIYGDGTAQSHQGFVGVVLDYDKASQIAKVQVRNPILLNETLEAFGPQTKPQAFAVQGLKNAEGEETERVFSAMEECEMLIPFAVQKDDYLRKAL